MLLTLDCNSTNSITLIVLMYSNLHLQLSRNTEFKQNDQGPLGMSHRFYYSINSNN